MQNNQPFDTRSTAYASKKALDLLVLQYMRRRVLLTLNHFKPCDTIQHPIVYNFRERHGRVHRIALYQCQELLYRSNLAFVGFISRKKDLLDTAIIDEIHSVDKALVVEMADNTGILSYSSLELRTGIWYNLVLMDASEAKNQVLHSETHAYASYQLAPRYYKWIRLHTGVMPYGLAHNMMKIAHTRYFTFQQAQSKPLIREHSYINAGTDIVQPVRDE